MNNIFSPASIARHLISVALLTGAATAMVAGSADPAGTATQRADPMTSVVRNENGENGELHGLIKACVESREKGSEACQKAIAASGLGADDFFARIAASFEAHRKKNEPKHETKKPETPANADVEALIKECIARYTDAAKSPEGASTAKEMCVRKFLRHEEKKPESRPGELVKACVNLAAQLNGDSSRDDVDKVVAVCTKAKAAFDN